MHILLFAFQGVPRARLGEVLAAPLREAFGCSVGLAPGHLRLPEKAYYVDREQFIARALVAGVAAAPAPPEAGIGGGDGGSGTARLGVAGHDLFATGMYK